MLAILKLHHDQAVHPLTQSVKIRCLSTNIELQALSNKHTIFRCNDDTQVLFLGHGSLPWAQFDLLQTQH